MKYLLIHAHIANNPIFAAGYKKDLGPNARVIYLNNGQTVSEVLAEKENTQGLEKLEIMGLESTQLSSKSIDEIERIVRKTTTLQELIFQYCSPMDKILDNLARGENKSLSSLKIRFAPKVSKETIEALVKMIEGTSLNSIQLYFDDSFNEDFNWEQFDPVIGALWRSSIKKIYLVPQLLQDKLLENPFQQQQAEVNKRLSELNRQRDERERNKRAAQRASIIPDKISVSDKDEKQHNTLEMDESILQSPKKEVIDVREDNSIRLYIHESVELLNTSQNLSFKNYCDFLAMNVHVLAILNGEEKPLGVGFLRREFHKGAANIVREQSDITTEKYFGIAFKKIDSNKTTQEYKSGIKKFQISIPKPKRKSDPVTKEENISLSEVIYIPASNSSNKEIIEIVYPKLTDVDIMLSLVANPLFQEFSKDYSTNVKPENSNELELHELNEEKSKESTNGKEEQKKHFSKKQSLAHIAKLVWCFAQTSPYILNNTQILEFIIYSLLTYCGLNPIKRDFNEIRITALVTNINDFIDYFVDRYRECYQSVAQKDIQDVNMAIGSAISVLRNALDNFIQSFLGSPTKVSGLATQLKDELYLYDKNNPRIDTREKTPYEFIFEILKIINTTLSRYAGLNVFQKKPAFEELLKFAQKNLMDTEDLINLNLVPTKLQQTLKGPEPQGSDFQDPEIKEFEDLGNEGPSNN